MTDRAADLTEEAQKFALQLTTTVRSAFGPGVPSFLARAAPSSGRFEVHQDPATGLVLTIGRTPRLLLKVDMSCQLDHDDSYLAVDTSKVTVLSSAHPNKEPLFRYEFIRDPRGTQASAHLQVHAHRDLTTYLMSVCGEGSVRSRRRRSTGSGAQGRIPQLSDLHFPLGGPRFRPCLEDILTMLIDEFGVDSEPGALTALGDGRERWRRNQLAAAVRDSPATALRVLRGMGYDVPDHEPEIGADRTDKLRML